MASWLRKNLVSVLLAASLLFLLFVPNAKSYLLRGLLRTGVFNASTTKQVGQQAAIGAVTLTNVKGERISMSAFNGKVIFLNFWATWCAPCVAEMGSVQALYNKLKNDSRIVFILADADNNPQLANHFMQKNGYDLPVYQLTGQIPQNIFNGTLPTTVIIDANGQLVQHHEGIANYNTDAMVAFLRSL